MKLDILNNAQKQAAGQAQPNQRARVVISPNPVKNRVFIDIDGNEIDPRTKRIIRLEKDVH